ncbi:cell division protein FtsK [Amycolatopsis sp. cg5]|uniref:cell division protein FtsK n=1 Tax=Amycolatopsis sp. cg5 TaxID=3238802 RepID=UPI003525E3C5
MPETLPPSPDDMDPSSGLVPAGDPEEVTPVDPPPEIRDSSTRDPNTLRGERRPIIAPWLRSASSARATVAARLGFFFHVAVFHLARLPLYGVRLTARCPRGLYRVTMNVLKWSLHTEARPLRQSTIDTTESEHYLRLMKDHDQRVRTRSLLVVVGLTSTYLVGTLIALCPAWTECAVIAAIVGVLGFYGSPADKPITAGATVAARFVRLTSDAVTKALLAVGVGGMKDADAIGFPSPITRDGPGWRADVDLPPGITAADVMERRHKLASALSRPLGCVWPEAAPNVHPGRLVLWVADQDMSRTKAPPWPLATKGTADVFTPQPIGTDPRGRVVTLTLMFASMVIGSLPRMGKSFLLRLILLIGALDPRVEIHCYDLKGLGDFAPLEPVAHRYRAGVEADDFLYILTNLREFQGELDRRAKTIRSLPRDLCPENKITPQLASNRSLGLHPIMVAIDECQKLFEHPEHGKEFEAVCEDLVRRGPASGIMLLLATQRPDAKSIPPGIGANMIIRFALKVMGQTENDMVLGTSAYRNGIRATLLSRSDLGIGILAGEGDDPCTVRGSYIDGPAAETIAHRARALRQEAGRLTGYAADQDTAPVEVARSSSLLADLVSAFHGETKAWSETLVCALAELRPDVYGGWGPAQLSSALKPYGLKARQVWGTDPTSCEGANRRGYHLADVRAALDAQQKGNG